MINWMAIASTILSWVTPILWITVAILVARFYFAHQVFSAPGIDQHTRTRAHGEMTQVMICLILAVMCTVLLLVPQMLAQVAGAPQPPVNPGELLPWRSATGGG